MYGELVPVGGGDPIPLIRPQMRIGRREDCDIILKFSNVSGHHCVMTLEEGYWFIKDLNSSNGVKVNGVRLTPDFRKRVDPSDEVSIAKNVYTLEYEPTSLGAMGPPPPDETGASIMGRSLLDRAGLNYNRNASGPTNQPKKLPPRRKED